MEIVQRRAPDVGDIREDESKEVEVEGDTREEDTKEQLLRDVVKMGAREK
jgi:hypothetical protein